MSGPRTLQHGPAELPIRTLRVEVTEGPDQGAHVSATGSTLSIGSATDNDLVLSCPTVSRYHLELEPAGGGVLVTDHGSTNGTLAGSVRIAKATVPHGSVLSLGATKLRVGEGEQRRVELFPEARLAGLWGRSPAMRKLMAQIQKVAQSDVSVLVTGESGTGKELVANALVELGARSAGPFVVVDCGALSPTLVASELFGHEKGAFTGADRQHIGAFERASGGTIFLDEIGELPPALQPALLGVLERKKLRRVGGKQDLSVDVRVISATHRELRQDVNAGTFRLDLFYRLAVVRLALPPLRERSDDIPLLVEQFLREAGRDEPVSELISDAAMQTLCAHRWPGNVRELRNLLEATLALGEPALPDAHDPPSSAASADVIEPLLELDYKHARGRLLDDFERRYLLHLLERTGGNVSKASRDAKIDRSHLNDMLRRHKLR